MKKKKTKGKKKTKRTLEEATVLSKMLVKKAHTEAQHGSALGRFKTIVGIDRTSIQKFLDSLLKSFRKYAEDDWSYNMAKDIIKEDLRDGDPDFWEDFQKGGDYPEECELLFQLLVNTLWTGGKHQKK